MSDTQEPQEVEETKEEVTEEEALENSKNPERTKEYIDKLQEEKKEAQEEVEKTKKEYKNVLESLRPEQPEQQPEIKPKAEDFSHLKQEEVDDVFASMMDDKGYIDGNKLLNTLKDMNEAVKKTQEENQKLRKEVVQTQQKTQAQLDREMMDKVHGEFPQLNPDNEGFDEAFYTDVRNELLSQLINGKQDPMGAAKAVYDRSYKRLTVNKEEKQEKKQQDNAKAQINATGTKSTVSNDYWKDAEEKALRDGARKGTKGSVAELLRRRGQ